MEGKTFGNRTNKGAVCVEKGDFQKGKRVMYLYWLTISQFAKRECVARNTVLQWVTSGKIKTWTPADGVRLIESKTPRPEKWEPWHKRRQEYFTHE